jgi:hypothetical protein
VEAGEGIEESRADHVPVPLEESRSKAIRPWTRVVIHSKKGSPDLFQGERPGQSRSLRRCEGGGGDKRSQVKLIKSGNRSSKKVFVKIMKNNGFSMMGEGDIAILILKVFSLVFSEANGGAKVKVAGVFVAQDAVFDFCTLPLVGCFVGDFLAERSFGKVAELFFQGREVSMFLEAVEERDGSTTVKEVDGREFSVLSPGSSGRADPF